MIIIIFIFIITVEGKTMETLDAKSPQKLLIVFHHKISAFVSLGAVNSHVIWVTHSNPVCVRCIPNYQRIIATIKHWSAIIWCLFSLKAQIDFKQKGSPFQTGAIDEAFARPLISLHTGSNSKEMATIEQLIQLISQLANLLYAEIIKDVPGCGYSLIYIWLLVCN